MRKENAKGGGQPAVFLPLLKPSLFPSIRLALEERLALTKRLSKNTAPLMPSLGGRGTASAVDEGFAVLILWAECSHNGARIFF